MIKKVIYIDALALVPKNKSGVGYTLEQTLINFAEIPEAIDSYTIYLVIPLGKAKHLQKYVKQNVKIKTIYLSARLFEMLLRFNLIPSLDWFLGRGAYIFPNYRNWPLWHSLSFTYIYDVGFIKHSEMAQPKNQAYLSRYISRWVARTDKIITITNQVKEEIEKYLGADYSRVAVVPCGVDTAFYNRKSPAEIAHIKEKYGISYSGYFLFVGNIEPRKNLLSLIDAYEKLPKKISDEFGLIFVGGDGWLNDDFFNKLKKAQSKGLKIVKINQYVPSEDLPALYSGAIALVHPAFYEGFGITPLEAMACGTAVVVSDIPAIKETVQSAAFYVDPYSIKSIATGLEKVVYDVEVRQENIDEGNEIMSQYSWKQAAETLLQTINTEFLNNINPRHPIIKRLKIAYSHFDRNVREILGDRPLRAYTPRVASNIQELNVIVRQDFYDEQSSKIQQLVLKVYLKTRHLSAQLLKSILHKFGVRK